jgi:ribosomal-protein-alanine N-acetyltransferase
MRGKGIGSALVSSLKALAKDKGLSFVSLEVRESNKAAIQLYSDLGFKVEGKRKDFYTKPTEAALVMVLRVK